jgi:hypothetical protein
MTATEYADYLDEDKGNKGGIGIIAVYDSQNNNIYVSEVSAKSPAQVQGIQKGDVITAVDSVKVTSSNYEELIKKHNLYKYYIDDTISLNNLLSSINDLNIVEVSDIDDIYKNICNKEHILYNLMAEQSIEDAVKSKKSEKYFGFKDVKDDKNILNVSSDIKNKILNSIISTKTIVTKKGKKITDNKKRYFLTFNGSGQNLFDLLHKEFKTKIFSANDYIDNISFKNKEILMQIIHKNLHIGKHLTAKISEYLVRLEAHMLLDINKDAWFVVENNEQLFDLKCFKKDSRKIPNKSAFVEISQDDYEDIQKFLSRFHELSNNDFNINTETTEDSEKKKSKE